MRDLKRSENAGRYRPAFLLYHVEHLALVLGDVRDTIEPKPSALSSMALAQELSLSS